MEFYSRHGCLPHEKETENLFVVDFKADTDMEAASYSDRLGDAVDYGKIYDMIAIQMAVHSDLIEHLAGKIIRALETGFPSLENITVRVSKRRPPVNGVAAWSRVTLSSSGKPENDTHADL